MKMDMFGLPLLDRYSYHILGYTPSHSAMQVAISRDGEEYHYLQFFDVVYIKGLTQWTGTNFQLSDEQECLSLLHQIEGWHTLNENILKEYKLYESTSANHESTDSNFKVISSLAFLLNPVSFEKTRIDIPVTPLNLSALESPEASECRCMLVGYLMPGFPYLTFEIITSENRRIFLNFEGVKYIECPAVWIGATFKVSQGNELLALLDCLNQVPFNSAKLFTAPIRRVATTQKQVRIIADSAHLTEEIPYFRKY